MLVIDAELSADERAALHASLDRALDDSEAGRGMDASDYLKQYRARREDRVARSALSAPKPRRTVLRPFCPVASATCSNRLQTSDFKQS